MITFTMNSLVQKIRNVFRSLPDIRKPSNNRTYEVEDAALSAFGVFFLQSPSFLEYQRQMNTEKGENNARSLFGVHQIPSDNQIRTLLDPVSPGEISPLFFTLGEEARQQGLLDPFRAIGGTFLVALDGLDFFQSKKISCPSCHTSNKSDGTILYRHLAVTPVLVAPDQQAVLPLPPEFVVPQDGHAKQDCESSAASRWIEAWGARLAPWKITVLGDDLYCRQPFARRVLAQGAHFIFVCKPSSHPTLASEIEGLSRLPGGLPTLVRTRWTGKRRETDTYRFLSGIPLRDGKDALTVNWIELVTTASDGTVLYKNSWATSHTVDPSTVEEIVKAGRCRWKIENENNNVLKNHGYHFAHNFGHGNQHLSNTLATLNLLAFLTHTLLHLTDKYYQEVRLRLGSRRRFFNDIRALTQYLHFPEWNSLMRFMKEGLDGNKSQPP